MQLRNNIENHGLDLAIFKDHAHRVTSITLLSENCRKVKMTGIEFKVKLSRAIGLEKIKTQKGVYTINQFAHILDQQFLTELELIEKAVKTVNWDYQYISDGKAHKAAKYNFTHVKGMVENATDKESALTIWNNYKK